MTTIALKKMITYLNLQREYMKLDKQGEYKDVNIVFPDDFTVVELWNKVGEGARFHKIEFPIQELDAQIKRSRDNLRYAKRKALR